MKKYTEMECILCVCVCVFLGVKKDINENAGEFFRMKYILSNNKKYDMRKVLQKYFSLYIRSRIMYSFISKVYNTKTQM